MNRIYISLKIKYRKERMANNNTGNLNLSEM